MAEWMQWTILATSSIGAAGSLLRVAQNERLWKHHLWLAKKKKKK